MSESQIIDDEVLHTDENRTSIEEKSEEKKISFPYERSVYIKGILAIPLAVSGFGFIFALYLINISLKRSSESLREYKKNPNSYKQTSLKRVKQGRTYAFIALAIWLAELLAFLIIYR